MDERQDFKIPRHIYKIQKKIKSKVKIYPNGDKKITTFNEPLIVYYDFEGMQIDEDIKENRKRLKKEISEEEKLIEQERIVEKRFREVKNKVIDYALSNEFTHFWNLTQDEKIVGDRYDDEIALNNLYRFLKRCRENAKKKGINFGYIFVPERHQDGAMHFHGLTFGYPYELIDSGHKSYKGEKVYHSKEWKYGFNDITVIRNRQKSASYIAKYLEKDMAKQKLGKFRKKYWCSKGLSLPEIEYYDIDVCENMKEDWVSKDGNIKIYNIKGDEKHG